METRAVSKAEYDEVLLAAAAAGRSSWREVLRQWKAGERFSILWGYNPPGMLIRLAGLLASLRARGMLDAGASAEALEIVREFSALRDGIDPGQVRSRAETRANGLPLFVNFFQGSEYGQLLQDLLSAGDLDRSDMQRLEELLPPTVELQLTFPEWGAMNRAMVRADGMDLAARILPRHPESGKWRAMAEALASDSVGHWEIEDASTYHPVWLYFLFRYLERRGELHGLRSPLLRWYPEFFLALLAPHGTIPDFGDGEWRTTWVQLVACFECAARETGEGRFRWAAARVFRACRGTLELGHGTPPGVPWELIDAGRWAEESIAAVEPDGASREALEDCIGKKIVLRDGWGPRDTYLLHTYTDEGSWGWLDRRYLRDTISVEEEKMHHGHSDENSIAFLAAGGSLLLHDGGYRDGLPSGPYGAFRADIFHNRLVVRQHRVDRGQDLIAFLQGGGAFRPVRTHKIDFQLFQGVDYVRTRLVDEATGYLADRIIVWLREEEQFIVVDGLSSLREDSLTAACLWHTQAVDARGDGWILGGYDSMGGEALPRDRRLLVQFLPAAPGRGHGEAPIRRHGGAERVFYEWDARTFLPGRWGAFVSRLAVVRPAGEGASGAPDAAAGECTLVACDGVPASVCVRLDGRSRHWIFAKLDLDAERAAANIRPRRDPDRSMVRAGPLETDAHFAHVCEGASGVSWSAAVLTRLAWNGSVAFDAPWATFGLQLDGQPDRESQAVWRRWEGTVPTP